MQKRFLYPILTYTVPSVPSYIIYNNGNVDRKASRIRRAREAPLFPLPAINREIEGTQGTQGTVELYKFTKWVWALEAFWRVLGGKGQKLGREARTLFLGACGAV